MSRSGHRAIEPSGELRAWEPFSPCRDSKRAAPLVLFVLCALSAAPCALGFVPRLWPGSRFIGIWPGLIRAATVGTQKPSRSFGLSVSLHPITRWPDPMIFQPDPIIAEQSPIIAEQNPTISKRNPSIFRSFCHTFKGLYQCGRKKIYLYDRGMAGGRLPVARQAGALPDLRASRPGWAVALIARAGRPWQMARTET